MDVIEVLTDSPQPSRYWNELREKLQNESDETDRDLPFHGVFTIYPLYTNETSFLGLLTEWF